MIMVAVPSRYTKALVEPCEIVAHHTALQLRSFALVYFYTPPKAFADSASERPRARRFPVITGGLLAESAKKSSRPRSLATCDRRACGKPCGAALGVGWRSPEGGYPSTTRPLGRM